MVKVAPLAVRRRGVALLAAAFAVGSLLLAGASAAVAANSPALRLIKTIPVPPTPFNPNHALFSDDISWVDPSNGLFLLGDRSNQAVDVVDTTGQFTGTPDTFFGQIGGSAFAGSGQPNGFAGDTGNANTSGPNGVASAFPCIFVSDGNSRVISVNANVSFTQPVSIVSTGGAPGLRADEIAYDPKDGVLVAANNADDPPFSTLITVNKSTCALTLGAKTSFATLPGGHKATNGAEQPQWEPVTQRFYVSLPEIDGPGGGGPNGAVAQVNPLSGTVEQIFPINFCQPAGLTVGPNGDLMVGCNTVFDFSGKACTSVVSPPDPTARTAKCTGVANPQVAICNPGKGCTGNSLVAVPGAGGGDEIWFNKGDGNYYVTAGNNPLGPTIGVINSALIGTDPAHALTQLIPTIAPVAAVAKVHGAGSVHSLAASAINNHLYVALPANTAYQNCTQGCIAVFAAQ